jgi:hypothetical protein
MKKRLIFSLLFLPLFLPASASAFSITGALSSIESIQRMKEDCPVCFSIAEPLVDSFVEGQLEELGIADYLDSDLSKWLMSEAENGFENINFSDLAPQIGVTLIEEGLGLGDEATMAGEIISNLVFSQQEEDGKEQEQQLVNQGISTIKANEFTEAAPSTLELLKTVSIKNNEDELRSLAATQNLQQEVEKGNVIDNAQLGIQIEQKKQEDLNRARLAKMAKSKILVLPNP